MAIKRLKLAAPTKGKAEKEEVFGLEAVVDGMVDLDAEIARLSEQRDTLRGLLLTTVKEKFQENFDRRRLVKTFVAPGDKGTATVTFKNSYAAIDPDNFEEMHQVLGDSFYDLFKQSLKTVMRPSANLDEMKRLLGNRFDDFFTTVEQLQFADEWMEKAVEVMPELTKRQASLVKGWRDQCQSSPSLSIKKTK